MSKRRYDELRRQIEMNIEMEKFLRSEESVTEDAITYWKKETVKSIRDKIKKIDREYPDRLEKPITKGWRRIYDDDYGETGYDYRIMTTDPDEWKDEEIEEYIMEEVGYPPICSPYDCTGKRFTAWVSWSKQPVGIVMIHRFGLDV